MLKETAVCANLLFLSETSYNHFAIKVFKPHIIKKIIKMAVE